MKLKISILILFLILSINNVMGLEQDFTISYSSQLDDSYTYTRYLSYEFSCIYFTDIEYVKGFTFLQFTPLVWEGSNENSDYHLFTLYNDVELTNPVGSAYIGFSTFTGGQKKIQIFIYDMNESLTGAQALYWSDAGGDLESMNCQCSDEQLNYGSIKNFRLIKPGAGGTKMMKGSYHMQFPYYFYNKAIYNINTSSEYNPFLNFTLERNNIYQSKIIIYNNNMELENETDFQTENYYLPDYDINNNTWLITLETVKGDIIQHEITYQYDKEDDETLPTLTTDKTYYNTSEIINISYTNINKIYNECISSKCVKPYNLYILYPITDEYKQYETKYIYPLTYLLENETISLNTSFLNPQNTYVLGIVGINGDYTQHEDILIFSDSFTVYPDNEYLSVSCDSETSCYTYNNADITIYYKIDNNSDIIIKDNNDNIINIYHNIIGSGEILYHIPDDLNHINSYPNWKVYLNNTGYSTSFNKGITVYWSQFQTPTPTPTYTPSPTPDINISDTIDEFKTETQPIKDLIFGLSEIVIDNPDYNKDNIVDESEINHWFNSLIPICIIFLLVVLYVGLKKKRE